MVVYGGYMHKHKEEEKCYDDQVYIYHLGCHIWMSHQVTSSTYSRMLFRVMLLTGVCHHLCVHMRTNLFMDYAIILSCGTLSGFHK